MRPKQAPLCFTVDASSDSGIAGLELFVFPAFVNGAGKIVAKSESAQWTINGNRVCITNSGGMGTVFYIFAFAAGNDGSVNAELFTVNVVRK